MSLIQLPLPFKVKKGLSFYSKGGDEKNLKVKQDSAKLTNELSNKVPAAKRNNKRSHDFLGNSPANDLSPTKRSRYSKSIENSSPQKQNKLAKIGLKIKKTNTFLQNASNALHGSNVSRLPGRENELSTLENFLTTHFNNKVSGSLYISGPPGTGKTASLSFLLDTPKFKGQKTVYVNCAALKSASSIYQKISQELKLKIVGKTEKAYLTSVENYLESDHNMILLVLDEIDQLDSKRQSVLYSIFDWPSRPSSNLILIGIANALDLTDRMLPRLQKKLILRPKLLHFPPYTKEQIVQILTARLSDAASNVFSPVALQLLAAKVAALSGDVRRALDLARLVIEVTSRKDTRLSCDMSTVIEDANTTVEVKQVLEVLDSIYGSSKKLESDIVEDFPLQQKLLICSLLLMVTKGKTKDITVGQLYEVYSRVGKRRNITIVDSVEFPSLCDLVQTRGIVKLSGKKEPRMHKISLHWDENEVLTALKDKKLISDILNDLSCLSR